MDQMKDFCKTFFVTFKVRFCGCEILKRFWSFLGSSCLQLVYHGFKLERPEDQKLLLGARFEYSQHVCQTEQQEVDGGSIAVKSAHSAAKMLVHHLGYRQDKENCSKNSSSRDKSLILVMRAAT